MPKVCFHCMRPLDASPVCRFCGYTNRNRLADAPYHLNPGTVLAERYLLGNVLGEGGFGITYIGLDTTLSKRVALKEFYPAGAANRVNTVSDSVTVTQGKEEFFRRGVERFLYEAKSVAAFSDEDGIVDVLDYFQANNTAYIVMEYLEGETLKDHVNRCGVFRADALISLMLPVMKSLGVMHARGVIHRDISPDNIMYTKAGRLKLMDFGSARYYTNEAKDMSVMLKQGFAPEEQYRKNGRQGPFTDVYALCATIYACITGKVPPSSLDRLAQDTLIPPSHRGVPISPAQERALMHGLALTAPYRTPNMDALMREFTAAPSPAAWQPPRQNEPPAEPPKKRNGALIAAVVISIVAVLAVGTVLAFILLSQNKGEDAPQPTGNKPTAAVMTDPTGENAVTDIAETTEEPATEEPTTVPDATEATETTADNVLNKDEINARVSVIADNFTKSIACMDKQTTVGDYAVTKTDDGYLWISSPKDEMKDNDHPKTWYFFNSDGELYFIFEITDYTQYRIYVDDDEIIRYTVGKPGDQTVYDMGDSHITDELQTKITKAYAALEAVR